MVSVIVQINLKNYYAMGSSLLQPLFIAIYFNV